MKAYEFPAKITPSGTLEVPEELLDSLRERSSCTSDCVS